MFFINYYEMHPQKRIWFLDFELLQNYNVVR